MKKTSTHSGFFKINFSTISILLLILISFFAGKFINGDLPSFTPVTPKSTQKEIIAPVSTFPPISQTGPQSYPIIDDTHLVWVSIDNPAEKNTGYSKTVGIYTDMNFAGYNTVPAPDLRKVAIVENHNELVIVSSDGSSVYPLPNLNVNRIVAWAPNSQKLIVQVNSPTVKNTIYPHAMEQPNPSDTTFDLAAGTQPGGFYLLDFQKNSSMHLPMLSDVEILNFIDSNQLLLSFQEPTNTGSKERLASFDLLTYKLDGTKLFNLFDGTGGSQFTFSADGKFWAATISKGEGTPENERMWVAVGKYPNFPSTSIRKGGYAQNQLPLISPDGSKVLYMSRDTINGSQFIQLYSKNTDKRVAEGRVQIVMWIDSDRFIYSTLSPQDMRLLPETTTYTVYNTNTNEAAMLHKAKIHTN
jgi:hypothetical protein